MESRNGNFEKVVEIISIKRIKKIPFKTEVYWDKNTYYAEDDLSINGKFPIIKCPKCKSELYAGHPDTQMPVFFCGVCGRWLKAGWRILNEPR